MKIGDAYIFELDGETKIVRKERDFYITFIERDASFYEIDELPFKVLKSTLENQVQHCIELISHKFRVSNRDAMILIEEIQKKLIELGLLSTKHILEARSENGN